MASYHRTGRQGDERSIEVGEDNSVETNSTYQAVHRTGITMLKFVPSQGGFNVPDVNFELFARRAGVTLVGEERRLPMLATDLKSLLHP